VLSKEQDEELLSLSLDRSRRDIEVPLDFDDFKDAAEDDDA